MEKEKLDNYSKILLATQSINYMAHGIYEVHKNLASLKSTVPEEMFKFHVDSLESSGAIIEHTVNTLRAIMENLGNYMNNRDCIAPIDVRVTEDAFLILSHGKDDLKSS